VTLPPKESFMPHRAALALLVLALGTVTVHGVGDSPLE
jgi:hypothetical protein